MIIDDNNRYQEAVKQIKQAILSSQYQAAKGVNAVQLSLYYGIGRYVSVNSRQGTWGTGAIANISRQLHRALPGLRGFGEANIKFMRQFYESWHEALHKSLTSISDLNGHDEQENKDQLSISVNSLTSFSELTDIQEFLSLGFSLHMMIIRKTMSVEERWFYIHQAIANKWNKHQLKVALDNSLHIHKGNLPNNFSTTMPSDRLAIQAVGMLKDEYLLDFINVEEIDATDAQDVDERVVENAIVRNIKKFINELGSGFCFIDSQYRLELGEKEFFIDLLFFSRDLKANIAIELKHGEFKPAYLGQLNFYLSLLDKKEKREWENPSIGLLLCQDLDKSVVELAIQDYRKPMGVATYRLPNEVPEQYKMLRPIMEQANKLLSDSNTQQ